MVTGDSLLTALHTARECSILDEAVDGDDRNSDNVDESEDKDEDGVGESSDRIAYDLRRRRGGRSNGGVLVLALSSGDGLTGKSSGIKGQSPSDGGSDTFLVWLNSEGDAVFNYRYNARSDQKKQREEKYVSGMGGNAHSHLVGMSARELSVIGGFELATSGNVIVYMSKGLEHGDGDVGTGHSRAIDELKYFKVSDLQ